MKKLVSMMLALVMVLSMMTFVSFASAEQLWARTGVLVGATTVLSAILPQAAGIHWVMDRAVAESEWFACTDGTATCFVKIRTADLLEKYLPARGTRIRLLDV